MTNWKFTDSTNRVVIRTHADGRQESCMVEVIADWIAKGNAPDPADPPTIAELNAPILAEIAAEEAKQGRAIREALLLLLPAGAEKDRLKAIDDKIVLARTKLQK
jgi:hypothetical protein